MGFIVTLAIGVAAGLVLGWVVLPQPKWFRRLFGVEDRGI